jgi:hypothetical protein
MIRRICSLIVMGRRASAAVSLASLVLAAGCLDGGGSADGRKTRAWLAASRAATKPPPRCAPRRGSAPTLAVLAHRAFASMPGLDGVAAIRVGSPPRSYVGQRYPGAARITRRSQWLYATGDFETSGSATPVANVAGNRAMWHATLLMAKVAALACRAGAGQPTGFTLRNRDGSEPVINPQGVYQRPLTTRPRAWPSAGATFASTLAALARRYGFHVVQARVLPAVRDAPQVIVSSDQRRHLIAAMHDIDTSLFGPFTNRVYADWFEAVDGAGRPYAFIETDAGGASGGQWVSRGLPYPFPHG